MGALLKAGSFVVDDDESGKTTPAGGRLAPGSFTVDEPGQLESLGRGAVQGASLGWADEVGGFLKAAVNPDRVSNSYEMERDKIRTANKAAKDANPKTYFAGELGGGVATAFVPGLGAARGAGMLASAGKGLLLGAAGGLGSSEATDAKGMFLDTAGGAVVGGTLGGAFGAAGKYLGRSTRQAAKELGKGAEEIASSGGSAAAEAKSVLAALDDSIKGVKPATAAPKAAKVVEEAGGLVAGAEGRLKDEIVKTIVRSANGKPRNDLVGKGGKMAKEVADFVYDDKVLRDTYRDGEAFYQAILGRKQQTGQALGAVVRAIDETGELVNSKTVKNSMDMVVSKLKADKRPELAKMVQAKADQIAEDFVTAGPHGKVYRKISADELWKHVQGAQTDAFQGFNVINPTVAKEAQAELAMTLRGVLNNHIEDVAAKANLPGSGVKALNARYSMLNRLEKVAENTSRRQVAATEVGPFSMFNARELASGGLTSKLMDFAGNVVGGAVDGGARAGNTGLAALGRMASSGSTPAQITSKALELGIPRATATMLGRIMVDRAVSE